MSILRDGYVDRSSTENGRGIHVDRNGVGMHMDRVQMIDNNIELSMVSDERDNDFEATLPVDVNVVMVQDVQDVHDDEKGEMKARRTKAI